MTSLAEARTTVLLDEIVTLVAADPRLVDPRVRATSTPCWPRRCGPTWTASATWRAAQWLHVHPNTVRYRVRRIEELLGTSLADPDVRLLLSLSLRATRSPFLREQTQNPPQSP